MVAAMVAVIRPLSWESVYAVAAVRPVSAGAVSFMMVMSGMENSFYFWAGILPAYIKTHPLCF